MVRLASVPAGCTPQAGPVPNPPCKLLLSTFHCERMTRHREVECLLKITQPRPQDILKPLSYPYPEVGSPARPT